VRFASLTLLAALSWCTRESPESQVARTAPGEASALPPTDASEASAEGRAEGSPDAADGAIDAERAVTVVDGPHQLNLEPGRPIYFAFPGGAAAGGAPFRLVAHLHGTCGPPPYACGKWIGAGVEVGALVCPTGNAHCGSSPLSPATWEAPSWNELVRDMDQDLERSIAIVERRYPHKMTRDGAILTGYSRGGYAVPFLASMHPGRWPFLLIIEADATLEPASLRRAGVRAVALVAGEFGDQITNMRKTAEALALASIPSQLFVMPNTGHPYSENMEDVMRGALAFLTAAGRDAGAPPP
jgi:hypothetical protein